MVGIFLTIFHLAFFIINNNKIAMEKVETQRVQYKRLQREYDEASGIESVQPNKRLNQERLRKLNEIGFAWSAKHVRKQRNNSLQAAQSPPTLPPPPPMDHAAFAENPLMLLPAGAGVAMPHPFHMEPQQQQHAVPPVPPVVRRKMVPNTSRLNDQQWEEMYQRLVRYKGQHGDCLVPRKYEADPKLSTWVETQRVRQEMSLEPCVPCLCKCPFTTLSHSTNLSFSQFLWNRDYRNAANASVAGTEGEPQDRNYSSSTMQSSLESMPDTMPPLPDPAQMPHAATFTHWTPGEDEDAAVVAAAAAAAAEAVDEEVDQNPPFVPPRDATTPRRLTKERKDKLDALGFVWSLRNKRIDDHWDEMFRQVRIGYMTWRIYTFIVNIVQTSFLIILISRSFSSTRRRTETAWFRRDTTPISNWENGLRRSDMNIPN